MSRSLVLLLLALLLTACSVVFQAPYDPQTDERLVILHRKVIAILRLLPGLSHEDAAPAFASVQDDLETLKARNQARPRNAQTLAQIEAIAATWSKLEALVTLGPMTRREVDIMRKALDVELRAAMALEMDKRRLQP